MKILIVSHTPWDDDNSFGNSYSNIFGGNTNYEIANIYCQSGLPNTQVCKRFFQISELKIIRSICKGSRSSGAEVFERKDANVSIDKRFDRCLNTVKILRWQIFFWIRDSIWSTQRWKSKALDDFIDNFNPDLIFQPVYYSSYVGEIGIYAKNRTKKPMVGYISDDNYTLKQFSLSPLFWIDRLIKRRFVKRTIDNCSLLYTITETQRKEYDRIFGKKCKVLRKGGVFDEEPQVRTIHAPIKLAYTGNLGYGRWKTLAMIAKCLQRLNRDRIVAQLTLCSQSPLSPKMKKALNVAGTSFFKGNVPHAQMKHIQADADILVHVESFELSERYRSRLSFSTKIVDYLEAGKCILAVGWGETGAIEYLKSNDAALVATSADELYATLKAVIDKPSMITEYARKGFSCGKKNHRINRVRDSLYDDLLKISNTYRGE